MLLMRDGPLLGVEAWKPRKKKAVSEPRMKKSTTHPGRRLVTAMPEDRIDRQNFMISDG